MCFLANWGVLYYVLNQVNMVGLWILSLVLIVMIARLRSPLAYLILIGSGIGVLGSALPMILSWISGNFGQFGVVINVTGILLLYFFYYLGLSYRSRLIEVEATAAKAQQALSSQRNQMLTNITHEFRTPITVIQGIAKQISGPANAQRRTLINRNAQRLKILVDQILDLQKIDAGKLDLRLQQGDVAAFLRRELASYTSLAESRGIQLSSDLPDEAIIMDYDATKMQQVVANLIGNAIKYTKSGGSIRVLVRARQDTIPPRLELQVADTGIGIAPAALPHIFSLFYQADGTTTRAAEGTGIGLALTRELVQLMGGQIEASSELEKGSTFSVHLPITQQAPMQDADAQVVPLDRLTANAEPLIAPVPPLNTTHDATILLVEDNADLLYYLVSLLAPDYQLLTALNGEEGLRIARQHLPDLIISDVMMPKMDGITMLQQLRQDARTDHLPIIILSAKASLPDRHAGFREGADAYLSKPFDEEELHLRVSQLLRSREILQKRYQQLSIRESIPDSFMAQFHQLLQAQLGDEDLSVEGLAQQLHLDRTTLFSKLKHFTGMAPSQYVRLLRLQAAQQLLQQSELGVAEVAYRCGFRSPAYFSRVYAQHFGYPPSKER
jgi:signal transduction histidine kinase/DNA-binding response OmpR family regulator